MIERFKSFIDKESLKSEKPVLIGTSGGRDSMVLCHLYLKANIPFAIAHCNFKLREEDSEGDESFVTEWAKQQHITIHKIAFDTKAYAEEKGISIQMAARDLRLNWFEQICSENNYEFYATAHHLDDSIETYLINQIRGTGLAGLHGILPKQGKLIHPLLFCHRDQITDFAKSHHIKWREDKSNSENKYLRNKVRNQLMPLLREMNPNIKSILETNIERLKASEEIYQLKTEEIKNKIISKTDKILTIDLGQLFQFPQKELVLYELINQFGFNYTQVSQILEITETESGAYVESETHTLLKNRGELLLSEKNQSHSDFFQIDEHTDLIHQPIKLKIERKEKFKIHKDEQTGQFDLNKLKFPLILRKWETGDYFQPLGMKGKKKLLSDYFVDEKMSILEKDQTWLLISGEEIVWVIGKRIDERFKISQKTSQILEIKWLK